MPSKKWNVENNDKMKAYKRDYYHRNKECAKSKVRSRKVSIREWMNEYKTKCACSKCGESHPATLHFHHTNPKEKDVAVAKATAHGYSIERIEKEIAKCVVLCANCHAKEHYMGLV